MTDPIDPELLSRDDLITLSGALLGRARKIASFCQKIMDNQIDTDSMSRDDLVYLAKMLIARERGIVLFLKKMGIWDDYRLWVSLRGNRKAC